MKKVKFLTLCFSAGCLSACATYQETSYTTYSNYQPYVYENAYYQTYDGGVDYRYSNREVNVPNSYHVGYDHSPASHKDVDKNWVNSQNPQGYTIEVAEGDKASQVAGKLYKVPKNNRTAQIKSYRGDGSAYYKGVYGSYNSYEEAQKAYNDLPENIKQGADIKNWSKIQENSGN
ncbi:SPOR domain-containing protein [Legionella cardiaca]|uniref:SPOR domain-containing protein n=1 Tax=Legionella cardiaca TaxID=1071983 RepID=A0ABY8AN21_9GAMM|nr:SPOR domain-containing protein [Legionella cardiaca]WED42094.1 SPOR domain-containing protein [Legionella cardiaca]